MITVNVSDEEFLAIGRLDQTFLIVEEGGYQKGGSICVKGYDKNGNYVGSLDEVHITSVSSGLPGLKEGYQALSIFIIPF